MNDQYEYLVRCPKFDTDKKLEAILNLEGAGGWILVSFLYNPDNAGCPFLAIFYRKKETAVTNT